MNDDDLRFRTDGDNTYRATANLNTAIENPQVNINGAMDVNLGNNQNINNVNLNQEFGVEQSINNNPSVMNNEVNFVNTQSMNFGTNNSFNLENGNVSGENMFISDSANIGSNNSNDTFIDLEDNKNDKDVYKPAFKQKKKPLFGIEVSREIKAMMFIIFVLLVVVFVIPYVYDFFRELDLVVTS